MDLNHSQICCMPVGIVNLNKTGFYENQFQFRARKPNFSPIVTVVVSLLS